MVYPRSNLVHMGFGDVGVGFMAEGNFENPVGSMIFYNLEQKENITTLPEDYTVREENMTIRQSSSESVICLSFSSAESIDAVISVLNAVKRNIFEDKKTRKLALSMMPEE